MARNGSMTDQWRINDGSMTDQWVYMSLPRLCWSRSRLQSPKWQSASTEEKSTSCESFHVISCHFFIVFFINFQVLPQFQAAWVTSLHHCLTILHSLALRRPSQRLEQNWRSGTEDLEYQWLQSHEEIEAVLLQSFGSFCLLDCMMFLPCGNSSIQIQPRRSSVSCCQQVSPSVHQASNSE